MKVKQIKVKIIEEASYSDLQSALEAWIATQTEAELVDLQYMVDGGNYSVLITYAQ